MPIFMEYGSLKGSAKADGHFGWMELDSCQFRPQGAIEGAVNEIVCTREMDGLSPTLHKEAVTGKPVTVTIHFTKIAKGFPVYLSVKLTATLIGSYSMSNTGDKPTETLSLTFGKIDFTYKLVKDDSDYYTRKPVREKVPERSW